jgi:hypothetical protein
MRPFDTNGTTDEETTFIGTSVFNKGMNDHRYVDDVMRARLITDGLAERERTAHCLGAFNGMIGHYASNEHQ